jgi:hypothetical protein
MGGIAMARAESATRQAQTIYEGPKADDEFTKTQFYLFTLVHYATNGFDFINRLCDAVPWPFVVAVLFLFAALCTAQPPAATAAALVAAVLWWFLVMTEGRRTLRILAAIILIAAIQRLLESTSFLPNPFKL